MVCHNFALPFSRRFVPAHASSPVFLSYEQSDDIVDPKPALEEQCHAPCKPLFDLVKACEVRVAKSGEGTCEPWLFDYVKCVDKCVSTSALVWGAELWALSRWHGSQTASILAVANGF